MATSLWPQSIQVGTNHNAMSTGSRKDWDEYLQERLCRIPPATLVVIEEIRKSLVDLGVPAPKKGQTMPTIEGFTPLVLALPVVVEPSLGFI